MNKFGYPAEEHVVATEDGYSLKIHRIPGSPNDAKSSGKAVVFMQHGVLASSDTWVLQGPKKDLCKYLYYFKLISAIKIIEKIILLNIIKKTGTKKFIPVGDSYTRITSSLEEY